MKISETRKEDQLYFKGPFWVIADSIPDLLSNKYKLLCEKELVTFDGELNRKRANRKQQTHEAVWKEYNIDLPYNYYPRGRVEVYKGVAYINLNSILNKPQIINDILKEYEIENLEYHVYEIDKLQGSHYNYLLK